MCRRYRMRPSSVLNLKDPAVALDFDLAMAAIHRFEEQSKLNATAEQNPLAAVLLSATMS